jgi:hypothetical protein
MKITNGFVWGSAIIILWISQLACQMLFRAIQPQTPTPPPSATLTEIPSTSPPASEQPDLTQSIQFTDEEIKEGIQKSLDLYSEAFMTDNPELLDQVVDQENKPFRRIVRSRFDEFQTSYLGGQIDFKYSVREITRRENGFVIARFRFNDGLEAQWVFRYADDTWVLSEPTVQQIGDPVTTDAEHFVFTSYPWADDVNPRIIDLMDTARQNVEDVLGKVPEEKAKVEIVPIYGLYPFDSMNAVAYYSKGATASEDRIVIYTPNSFVFSYYNALSGWDKELEQTLTHEYTHMAHARSFDNAGRLADWMSEGLAEYVAGAAEDNSYWACDAYHSGTFIPIMDETKTAYKQDLMHMYGLDENFGLSYDFATSLVTFTVEKHGGLEGFWKLAHAFDETSDFKEAVQETIGISYDEYNTQWQTWLRKQC